jgi:hypothetical protein
VQNLLDLGSFIQPREHVYLILTGPVVTICQNSRLKHVAAINIIDCSSPSRTKFACDSRRLELNRIINKME